MPYKKKLGDRKDGRRLRSLTPYTYMIPYIMKTRVTSSNFISDSIDISNMEAYIRRKRQAGLKSFGIMHVLIAAYVRACSQLPALNRFISGQRIFSRDKVVVNMVIKKSMNRESPDTCVKYTFDLDATADQVYRIMQDTIENYRAQDGESGFDKLARVINYIPGVLLKFTVWLLMLLDYFGALPSFLTDLSPFHGSLFISSIGSLGIPPIYHHLYDFGNVPVFLTFGAKRKVMELNSKGEPVSRKYLDYTFVLDERICDGYYYASSLKLMRSLYKHPEVLDAPPEEIIEDVR